MSVYDYNDLERLINCSTSTGKQIELIYCMVRYLEGDLEKVKCKISNYNEYREKLLCLVEQVSKLDTTQKKVITTLNALIEHVKCFEEDTDTRLKALEEKKMTTGVNELKGI